jgi:hypothetical protein
VNQLMFDASDPTIITLVPPLRQQEWDQKWNARERLYDEWEALELTLFGLPARHHEASDIKLRMDAIERECDEIDDWLNAEVRGERES